MNHGSNNILSVIPKFHRKRVKHAFTILLERERERGSLTWRTHKLRSDSKQNKPNPTK